MLQLERISEKEIQNSVRWTGADYACYWMGKDPSTILRWIYKGRVRAARCGGMVVLRTIDLMRIVYAHPRNREHVKTCMRKPREVKVFSKIHMQNPNLNRVDSGGSSPEAAAGAVPPNALEPRDAAVALQYSFGRLAKALAPKDPFLQDDLIQEMSLVVLQSWRAGDKDYFYRMAKLHAIDYLKYERVRGFVPLDRINEPRGIPRELPDELLVQAMLEDGYKLKTIEEILDAKVTIEEAV